MEKLTYNFKDGVAIIAMDDGKANALGSQTWAELNDALDRAEKDDAIVILTGREGMMSGGFDLKERNLRGGLWRIRDPSLWRRQATQSQWELSSRLPVIIP